MSRLSLGVAPIFLATTFACAPEDGPAKRSTAVRDSAGIRIVETAGALSSGNSWRLSSEPAVSIGESNGNAVSQLFQVVDAVRLSDGRI